jgi:hypothetical protein
MLLLSNRKSDIFEKLDIHCVWRLAFGVRRSRFEVLVNLHEISLVYPKIRNSEGC